MVLSMLTAVLLCPALLGTQESIRQSQAKEKREEHRARRCNLIATCVKSSLRSREIDGRPVVLRNGKLYIDTGTSSGAPFGHHYAGYYLPYPDTKYEGLVTTITDVAPIMNWVYVDKETHEVKYGVRADAQPNLTGPFNCTRQDRRLTFDGWEGWCAVEEYPSIWALYFDQDDDGLRSKIPMGTRVLEVELTRKEKRFQKEIVARTEDQKIERAVDAQGQTPVEKPAKPQSPSKAADSGQDEPKNKESNPASATEGIDSSAGPTDDTMTAGAPPERGFEPEAAVELQQAPNTLSKLRQMKIVPYKYDAEGTTGSPTDPHGGSDWSVHGDEIASTRSLAGYTPASSVYGDEAVDESPLSSNDHALKSPPPPLPPIPEAYCPETGTHEDDAEPGLISHIDPGRANYMRPYVEDDASGGV